MRMNMVYAPVPAAVSQYLCEIHHARENHHHLCRTTQTLWQWTALRHPAMTAAAITLTNPSAISLGAINAFTHWGLLLGSIIGIYYWFCSHLIADTLQEPLL